MHASLRHVSLALLLSSLAWGAALAQQPAMASFKGDALEPAPIVNAPLPQTAEQHKFWDTRNRVLFTGVAAFSAADFAVTRANLQNGGRELNPVTRMFGNSTAGLALNFAGETAGVIGISYLFHKTGHHKLERVVSMVNIGGSAAAVGFGLAHR